MKYRTLLADPAWRYHDKLRQSETLRSSDDQYKSTMSVEEVCALWDRETDTIAGFEVEADAFLFLWVTNPMLLDGSGAAVCRAWRFVPKQIITWLKGRVNQSKLVLQTGMGFYTRGVTEHLILATRGRCTDLVQNRGQNNLLLAEEDTVLLAKRGRHSAKPEAAHQLIERVCPPPYLELFAREQRNGWISWGNEL